MLRLLIGANYCWHFDRCRTVHGGRLSDVLLTLWRRGVGKLLVIILLWAGWLLRKS
jgi:hypothetical protein